jgi:uncharacterized protein YjiS (DUF1127 family)
MSNQDLSNNLPTIIEFKSIQQGVRSILRRFSLFQALKNWQQAYSRRQRLLNLLNYDDNMLDDMGYTRQDLYTIARLPLSADAHQVLKRLKEERKIPLRKR